MPGVIPRALVAPVIALGLIASAAAETAEDAISYRHAVMNEMAAHMSALKLILLGEVDGAAEFALGHAESLARATIELDVLFPEVSRDGETEALPVIWNDPGKFAQAVSKMQDAAGDFMNAVAGGDQKTSVAAFSAAGKSCKGCHEVFRAEEDDSDSHSH